MNILKLDDSSNLSFDKNQMLLKMMAMTKTVIDPFATKVKNLLWQASLGPKQKS